MTCVSLYGTYTCRRFLTRLSVNIVLSPTKHYAGQRSWLSVPQAATVIVKACRRYLRAFFGAPAMKEVEVGLRFARRVEEAWMNGGGRLSSTLNYALVRANAPNMFAHA